MVFFRPKLGKDFVKSKKKRKGNVRKRGIAIQFNGMSVANTMVWLVDEHEGCCASKQSSQTLPLGRRY